MANYQNIVGYQLGQAAMGTAYSIVYAVPSSTTVPAQPSTRTFVKDITIVNTTAASIGIYVHLVPSSGSVGTSNAIFYNNALPGYTTVQWNGIQIMNPGDNIQVKSSATGCTVTISGGQGT
jgi:hypothetical protein